MVVVVVLVVVVVIDSGRIRAILSAGHDDDILLPSPPQVVVGGSVTKCSGSYYLHPAIKAFDTTLNDHSSGNGCNDHGSRASSSNSRTTRNIYVIRTRRYGALPLKKC